MILPHFASTQRTLRCKVFFSYQIISIRHPASIVYQSEIFFGYLFDIGAIRFHNPDIIATTSITSKRNMLSIWTKTRLDFKRNTRTKYFGISSCNWHAVNISQHIKNNRFPIWTNIKIHPSAFGSCKVLFFVVKAIAWFGNIPFGFFWFIFFLLSICKIRNERESE